MCIQLKKPQTTLFRVTLDYSQAIAVKAAANVKEPTAAELAAMSRCVVADEYANGASKQVLKRVV